MLMNKKELLHILNKLPDDSCEVFFEAEDLGEISILSAVTIGHGTDARLILVENFEDFGPTDDDEEGGDDSIVQEDVGQDPRKELTTVELELPRLAN